METMFTVEDAAQTLKVTENTIRRWLRAGTLRGRKLGRVWRIPENELRLLGSEIITEPERKSS